MGSPPLPPYLEFCALFLFSRWLFQTSSFWKENNWFQSIGSIFQAPLFKIALVYKPATWISIMRCHWKGLLPVSTSLGDVLSSELKNSKLFLTLQFAQQKRGIVLQTNFFTSSLHLCQNIFACTNCLRMLAWIYFCKWERLYVKIHQIIWNHILILHFACNLFLRKT